MKLVVRQSALKSQAAPSHTPTTAARKNATAATQKAAQQSLSMNLLSLRSNIIWPGSRLNTLASALKAPNFPIDGQIEPYAEFQEHRAC